LRRLFERMDPVEFDVAGTAFQVQHWDRVHQHCAACAGPLELAAGERAKRCRRCGTDYYPRIAPVAIVLVHDGPRVLLARSPRLPAGMYALVAGFVEAGETLEACAAREVREETAVEIDRIEYFGSQPWPFPHQLMVGFTARYAAGEIAVDRTELEDARWFDVAALPALPPRVSIARRLIDAWIARVTGTGDWA
jgi:NAD+ diphosphatase